MHLFSDKISKCTKEEREMEIRIEKVLYIDIQAAKPIAQCPDCGGEIYGAGSDCLRCEWLAYDPA